ncbi:hypothetical protein D3C83_219460 [compost metagenome]
MLSVASTATQSVPVPVAMPSLRRERTPASITAAVRASTTTANVSTSAGAVNGTFR